ncbi:MAG: Bifunctional oligoribonuclease and PAP phosphatase NrnA [Anaerolineales bacterium]|nr:Bifunctional oligoribonuclease and PAP phosphatase NrnA [Anaerolineales bacterium]
MSRDAPTLHVDLDQPALAFAEHIRAAERIYIGTHIDPDGDAIGSLLGLAWALRDLGKQVTAACADSVPDVYGFLPGSDGVTHEAPVDEDLIISLDAGGLDRLGKLYDPDRFAGKPVVNIDHHVTNTRFGDVVLVDPQAAATTEILYLLADRLELPLPPQSPVCFLTGIMTDTRSFRTSNTTPRVLQVAARLMQAGAPLTDIVQQIYESKPVASLCLLGQVLESMHKADRIIWSELTHNMLRACHAKAEDANGIINLLNSTHEADMAILFREDADGSVDVGFRSKPHVNVAEIAVALGGGGHPQASGCQLSGALPDVRDRVLNTVRRMRNGKTDGEG